MSGVRDRQPDEADQADRLAGILLKGLEELAAAGNVEQACRLAGHACVTLRKSDPLTARRFDVLLHRLARRLTW